jgi:hypothetical protein
MIEAQCQPFQALSLVPKSAADLEENVDRVFEYVFFAFLRTLVLSMRKSSLSKQWLLR